MKHLLNEFTCNHRLGVPKSVHCIPVLSGKGYYLVEVAHSQVDELRICSLYFNNDDDGVGSFE